MKNLKFILLSCVCLATSCVEQQEPYPANNEIWYTTNDNNLVNMNISSDCTNAIVSNEYIDGKGVIRFENDLTEIPIIAFEDCENLESIIIPNGVISIGSGSFSDCKSLTSIIIPNSVTEIRGNAFGWCTSLTSITIPDNVVLIGDNAFSYCESLKEVNCKPKNPPVGGSGMFDYNASDRIIYVPYESLQLYQLAPYWSHYTYFIEGAYFE